MLSPYEADELPQERDRQQVLPFFVLLLENDLGEHRAVMSSPVLAS